MGRNFIFCHIHLNVKEKNQLNKYILSKRLYFAFYTHQFNLITKFCNTIFIIFATLNKCNINILDFHNAYWEHCLTKYFSASLFLHSFSVINKIYANLTSLFLRKLQRNLEILNKKEKKSSAHLIFLQKKEDF